MIDGQRKEKLDQTLRKSSQVPAQRGGLRSSRASCSHLEGDSVYVSSSFCQAQQAAPGSQLNITTSALTDQQWPAGKDNQGLSCQPEVLGLAWRVFELARDL